MKKNVISTPAPPVSVRFSCTWRQPLDRWDRSHTHPKMPLPPVTFAAASRCSGEAGVPSVSETSSELCLEIIPPRRRVPGCTTGPGPKTMPAF